MDRLIRSKAQSERRGAGRFLSEAFTGVRPYYQARTQMTGQAQTWPDRLSGILARQKGRHDYGENRPTEVSALSLIVCMQDVDDLLTLLMAALYEHSAQQVLDAQATSPKGKRETRTDGA